jgi:hypothetical protein
VPRGRSDSAPDEVATSPPTAIAAGDAALFAPRLFAPIPPAPPSEMSRSASSSSSSDDSGE